MFKKKDKRGKLFFLYNIVKPDWNLKKDESKMLRHILISVMFLLVIIDLVAMMFYMKTKERIEDLRAHNFTQVIKNNIDDSQKTHEHFSIQAKKIIENKNLHMIQSLDILEYNSKQLNQLSFYKINLFSLPKLKRALQNIRDDPTNQKLVLEAALAYQEVEEEMKQLNNYILPVNLYFKDNTEIDREIKTFLKEIKGNLHNFLKQLTMLQEMQNRNQIELSKELNIAMQKFNATYSFIKKDGKFVKLNNYYETEFISFDRNYVPFTIEYADRYHGAQLTKKTKFELKLPRIYYCNLRAGIYSQSNFSVKFQYIEEYSNGREEVIFESDTQSGGYKKMRSYNEFHVFSLRSGEHNVYIRVVSDGTTARTHFIGMRFACLSYRNFKTNDDDEE